MLEIDLPDMSGFEVLAKLIRSACHPEIAVVVLTAHPNPYLLELALKNGAKAALQKMPPSGHIIEKSILGAIASVKQDRERRITRFEQEFVEGRGRAAVRHKFSLAFRTVTVPHMVRRLEKAGLEVAALLGDYQGGPWDLRAEVWIILARRG